MHNKQRSMSKISNYKRVRKDGRKTWKDSTLGYNLLTCLSDEIRRRTWAIRVFQFMNCINMGKKADTVLASWMYVRRTLSSQIDSYEKNKMINHCYLLIHHYFLRCFSLVFYRNRSIHYSSKMVDCQEQNFEKPAFNCVVCFRYYRLSKFNRCYILKSLIEFKTF